MTKQLPRSIEKLLSKLYLVNCGFNEKLTYENTGNTKIKKTLGKTENAILHDLTRPTVNCGRQTSVNTFFRLLNKHFPPRPKFLKIFNKNTRILHSKIVNSEFQTWKLKMMDTIKKLENTLPPKTILSNCFRKEHCPMRGACLTENVLNYTKICCDNEKDKPKSYKGICKTTFKKL